MTKSARIALAVTATLVLAGAGYFTWRIGTHQADRSKCRDAVVLRLKSPSSAMFSDQTISEVNGYRVIRGTVDAENGFGASLRLNYSCTMTGDGASVAIDEPE